MKHFGLHYMGNYTAEQIKSNFSDYFKFMFVRNPFERLLSAYVNKIEHPLKKAVEYAYIGPVRGINIMFRHNNSLSNDDVTFQELLHLLISRLIRGKTLDEHYDPYKYILNPCNFKFDFIGKSETFAQDAAFVFKHLFNETIELPHVNPTKPNKPKSEYYSTMPTDIMEKIHEQIST